ncbi:hypothetical protein BCR44DRAFT_46544 [Catenaria anguillulae PL171]|uniref:Uncharacterized protein n=1 Tax=Catenaria anguillulae PL171 TaxID=765915 RepID=A0A1Y2H429_9FUNG|nr:hypothetical protein BCR44DRAFT_46544 [Catenaria anguillulae PL171]
MTDVLVEQLNLKDGQVYNLIQPVTKRVHENPGDRVVGPWTNPGTADILDMGLPPFNSKLHTSHCNATHRDTDPCLGLDRLLAPCTGYIFEKRKRNSPDLGAVSNFVKRARRNVAAYAMTAENDITADKRLHECPQMVEWVRAVHRCIVGNLLAPKGEKSECLLADRALSDGSRG